MYNHYIPQSDGSHRRSGPDPRRNPSPRPAPPRPKPEPTPPPPPPEQVPHPPKPPEPGPPPHCHETLPPPQSGIWDFLRGLLPRQIDTADLMILFLLLLMNRDCEDSLSPMLTLALYFLL